LRLPESLHGNASSSDYMLPDKIDQQKTKSITFCLAV